MTRPIFELIPGLPAEDQAAIRKLWGGDHQPRWGLGERPALLVVDMTRAFVEDRWPTGWEATGRPCARAIARLRESARAAGLPVLYTVTAPALAEVEVGAWLRGRPGPTMFPFDGPPEVHEVVDELTPGEGEVVYVKEKPSAFFASPLAAMLTYLRVDSVVVTGMTTSGCVRATVNDAFSHNYRVTVPVDCVADRSQLSHRVELLDMGAKYADLVHSTDLAAEIEAR